MLSSKISERTDDYSARTAIFSDPTKTLFGDRRGKFWQILGALRSQRQSNIKYMTSQQLFDGAYSEYLQARDIIAEMCGKAETMGLNYPVKTAFCQFDIIVQYVLLRIALADGKFTEIEGEFIDKLTDSYDVLSLFGADESDRKWGFAGANLTFEQIKRVIDKVEQLAHCHMRQFVHTFALVDGQTSEDYIQELCRLVKNVAGAFILADKHGSRSEIVVAHQTVRECLLKPWLNFQQQTD